jgi:hypothetical protein
VPEQRRGVQAKVVPHAIDVFDIGDERHVLGPNACRGAPPPALIVVDEAECVGESIQIGQEIAVVEIGTPMKDDDRRSLPNRSDIERRRADGDPGLDGVGVWVALQCARGVWWERYHERQGEVGGDDGPFRRAAELAGGWSRRHAFPAESPDRSRSMFLSFAGSTMCLKALAERRRPLPALVSRLPEVCFWTSSQT